MGLKRNTFLEKRSNIHLVYCAQKSLGVIAKKSLAISFANLYQGGREHLAINYTSPQSLILTFPNSLNYQPLGTFI